MKELPDSEFSIPDNSTKNQSEEDASSHQRQSDRSKYIQKQKFLKGNGFFQMLFFTWIGNVLSYGNKYDLTQDAIPKLMPEDTPKVEYHRLRKTYAKYKDNFKTEGWAITKSLIITFKRKLIIGFILATIALILELIPSILTNLMIAYVQSQSKNIWEGVIYFLSLFGVLFFNQVCYTHMFNKFEVLSYCYCNSIRLMIFQKALKHPLTTQKQFGASQIINYSQVDAQRLKYVSYQIGGVLVMPLQFIATLVLLYYYIGVSFLVGIGVMIITMVITLFMTQYLGKVNDQLLKRKDNRMKITEQTMQIIKFIKISALERNFFHRMNEKREKQLAYIKKNSLANAAMIFLFWICPPLIVGITFIIYSALGNEITASIAFVVIILFNVLQFSLIYIPNSIVQLVQIWSSIKRIQKFLRSKQLTWQHINYQENKGEDIAIQIRNGTFLWGKQRQKKDSDNQKKSDEQKKQQKQQKNKNKLRDDKKKKKNQQNIINQNTLKQSLLSEQIISDQNQDKQKSKQDEQYIQALDNINFDFRTGEVTMVIGDIGSGKSSLLYSIINEMTADQQHNPKITVRGSIAYVPQKPWIFSGTIRANILFMLKEDEKRFNDVIHYACLQDDLRLLPGGLETEIGEKGVTLSGGQKARVALARALYSNRDIYLLDDIISAVDVNVGKFIMEETVKIYLKGKTVIMPTHAINYLKHAHTIIIMDQGKILISGNYQQISEAKEFSEIKEIEEGKQMEIFKKKSVEEAKISSEQRILSQQLIKIEKKKSQQIQNLKEEEVIQHLIIAEDHQRGKVTSEMYLSYIELNGGKLFVFGVAGSLILWTSLATISNIEIQQWCEDPENSKIHLYLYIGFSLLGAVFTTLRSVILALCGVKQSRTIHRKMTKSLLYASVINFYNRIPIGRILNRLSKDLKEVDESLGMAVGDFTSYFFKFLGCLVMCVYASTYLIIIPILIFLALCYKLQDYYLKTQRQCVRLENISASPIVSGFSSAINGVATIRAYNSNEHFLAQQIEFIDINKRNLVTKVCMQNWFAFRLSMLSFIVNLMAIGYALLSSNQNGSLIGLLLAYSLTLASDLINTVFCYASMETKMISIERVMHFTKIDPENGYKQISESDLNQHDAIQDISSIKKGDIQFKQFSAKYRPDLPFVIKKMTLKINAGQKVGIVGRTGAGKSTLLNCLIRIVEPHSGSILIDDKDIMQYELSAIRSSFTIIEQEPTLIQGSFKQNLDPIGIFTEETIIENLKECNLWELVENKGGITSPISNQSLSAGEKQLLCICRAFLKKSKIVLIDQATANIDIKNDQLIQQLISTKFKNSTVLTIAHRLSTLKNSDKILVLGEGKVLEWGTVNQLMNTDSIYRKMCEKNDQSYFE